MGAAGAEQHRLLGAAAATAAVCSVPPPAHDATAPLRALLQLEEESLRDNFVIAFELLDEVMDFGYVVAWQWVLAGAHGGHRSRLLICAPLKGG
jgi:hypothetical protein